MRVQAAARRELYAWHAHALQVSILISILLL
jgi:hypothetical protein